MTNLETERNRVRWLVDSDVKKFRDALGDGNWAEATEHYSGQLLEGIKLETSPAYDDWLAQERERLQAAWREAVLNQTETLQKQGQTRLAAQQLQELLKQDSLAEDVLQTYMRLALTDESQRGLALRAFEAFRESLQQELGMTPLETTLELAEKLRSGRPSAERTQTEVSEPSPETTPPPFPTTRRRLSGGNLSEQN